MKRVIVLGAGFAGLAAALRLARNGGREVSVTLIDQRDETGMWPLLPDVVSGRVRAGSVTSPIRPLTARYGIRFVKQRVREIAPDGLRVAADAEDFESDFTVIALGCVTNYFGMNEMARKAPGLKSVSEARTIRKRVLQIIDKAEGGAPPGIVVVVGGGYTGFETAAHVAHLVRDRTKLSFDRIGEVCNVLIVEKADATLRNTFNRLCVRQTRRHSACICSSPRNRNCRKPRQCLIWPNGGSTIALRRAYSRRPRFVRSLRAICSFGVRSFGGRPRGASGARS